MSQSNPLTSKLNEIMNKAIIYCRVSAKEQAEQGYSLERQEKSCRKFALDNDYEVSKVFIERVESAKTQNRTELINLLKYTFQIKGKSKPLSYGKLTALQENFMTFLTLPIS